MRERTINEAIDMVEMIKESKRWISFETKKNSYNGCDLKVFVKENGKRKQTAAMRILPSIKHEDGTYELSSVCIRMLGNFVLDSYTEEELYDIRMSRLPSGEVSSINMTCCEGSILMGYFLGASEFVEDMDLPVPMSAGSENLEVIVSDLDEKDKQLASRIRIGLNPDAIRRIATRNKTY